MSEQPPPIERHAAADRFGKRALGAVHDITVALAEADDGAGEPGPAAPQRRTAASEDSRRSSTRRSSTRRSSTTHARTTPPPVRERNRPRAPRDPRRPRR